MKFKKSRKPILPCPCCAPSSATLHPPDQNLGPTNRRVVRKGYYSRTSDGRKIQRFHCLNCKREFSSATFHECYRQKKRHLNFKVYSLLCSGVSQRRIAKVLQLNRKTVVKKFIFLSSQAKKRHKTYLKTLSKKPQKLKSIHFDEMESYEHSKCLPVSIPLVVEASTRKIIGFRVCKMPCNGPLAAISVKKYGRRSDERGKAVRSLFTEISPLVDAHAVLSSDQNPKYPSWIGRHFPKATHQAFKGRRGCIAGQGELKKIGRDPLFDLNHTAAMLRANVNRLFRRTWCTTKHKEHLENHIALYADYHNRFLTREIPLPRVTQ